MAGGLQDRAQRRENDGALLVARHGEDPVFPGAGFQPGAGEILRHGFDHDDGGDVTPARGGDFRL